MSFIRKIVSTIILSLSLIIVTIGAIALFFIIQIGLSGDRNYLLFVSTDWNMIPAIMLVLLVFYFLFYIKDKLTKEKISREDKNIIRRFQRAPKPFKIVYILIFTIVTYCGLTSYTVLYNNSVKVSTPLVPAGITYKYIDIKSIDVGIRRAYNNEFTPFYKLKFNNNKSVNLLGSSISEQDGRHFEDILIDLDKDLKTHGVSKNVSKKNFEKYSKGLNKEFISKMEKLFL